MEYAPCPLPIQWIGHSYGRNSLNSLMTKTVGPMSNQHRGPVMADWPTMDNTAIT